MEILGTIFNILFVLALILTVLPFISPKLSLPYSRICSFMRRKGTVDAFIYLWTFGLCLIFVCIILFHNAPINESGKILSYTELKKEVNTRYDDTEEAIIIIEPTGDFDISQVTQADILITLIHAITQYREKYGYQVVKMRMENKNDMSSPDYLAYMEYAYYTKKPYTIIRIDPLGYSPQELEYIHLYRTMGDSHFDKDEQISKQLGIAPNTIQIFNQQLGKPNNFCLSNQKQYTGYECIWERISLRYPKSPSDFFDMLIFYSLLLSIPLLFLFRKHLYITTKKED